MKIYISADLEGVNGVVLKEHVDPAAKEFEQARRWMMAEVQAAIAGALAGGATQVVVNDSHNNMVNLFIDGLPQNVILVSGLAKPYSMMQEIDESFGAAF